MQIRRTLRFDRSQSTSVSRPSRSSCRAWPTVTRDRSSRGARWATCPACFVWAPTIFSYLYGNRRPNGSVYIAPAGQIMTLQMTDISIRCRRKQDYGQLKFFWRKQCKWLCKAFSHESQHVLANMAQYLYIVVSCFISCVVICVYLLVPVPTRISHFNNSLWSFKIV